MDIHARTHIYDCTLHAQAPCEVNLVTAVEGSCPVHNYTSAQMLLAFLRLVLKKVVIPDQSKLHKHVSLFLAEFHL